MSAETAVRARAPSLARGGPALRFGLGIVFALLIGHIIDMPLAFMAPVFAVGFLLPAPAPPDPRKLIAVPIVVGVVAVLVDAVGGFLAPTSDVLVLVFALVLFVCFHADALRGPGPVVGLVLTVTLIVGTLAANAEPIVGQIVRTMFLAALSASLATIIAYAVVPHTWALIFGRSSIAWNLERSRKFPYRKRETDGVLTTSCVDTGIVWNRVCGLGTTRISSPRPTRGSCSSDESPQRHGSRPNQHAVEGIPMMVTSR